MPTWTERMQVTVKETPEPSHEWSSAQSARVVNPQTKLEMPPGYDCEGTNEAFSTVLGDTDVSSQRIGLNKTPALRQGFAKSPMTAKDGQYEEGADQFYGDAGGFCERNAYLDR